MWRVQIPLLTSSSTLCRGLSPASAIRTADFKSAIRTADSMLVKDVGKKCILAKNVYVEEL